MFHVEHRISSATAAKSASGAMGAKVLDATC